MTAETRTMLIELDEKKYEAEITIEPNYEARYGKRSADIYIGGEPDPAWDHPPYTIKGEDPEADAGWRKYNREELRIKRPFAEAAARLIQGADRESLRFDRKTGCSCGCSPGFRVMVDPTKGVYGSVRAHVSVTEVPTSHS